MTRLRDSGNTLLDSLPGDEFGPLEPLLHRVAFTIKQVLHQFDTDVTHIYFPTSAMASLLTILEEDQPVEAMTVGRDGFIGMSAALGVEASPHRVICQMGGETLRLPLHAFLEAMKRGPELARTIHRYIAYSQRVACQALACNALHPVESRAARWLLQLHDQAPGDEFPMTQEFLAYMLGVRRQTVTVVSGTLQSAGLIAYRRGLITVLGRPRLEEASCECYSSIRGYYNRIIL
jgi:CRP-like cAMP-binding protein